MSQRGPGPIPNRWLHCPRKSETLVADKFLAFKTPLSEKFESQMSLDCIFTPDMLFQVMKLHKVKIGLWIDLTNTTRFYDRKEIEATDCQYIKLQCRGHGETPSLEQTQSFIEIVEEFIKTRPLDLIGVHCTHGFNRTGFLIISYMVEKLDCSVEAALATFARARPPGIYKQDYINELFRRYEDEEDAVTAPELPDWCNEFDDGPGSSTHDIHNNHSVAAADTYNGDPDDDVNDGHSNKRSLDEGESSSAVEPAAKRKRKEFKNKNAQFMDGVAGVSLVADQPRLQSLQEKIQQLCNWTKGGFPGCQPVSMDLKNLQFLHTMPYKVSWKADGTRYMMLINKEHEVFFYDRDNSVFEVTGVRFPHRKFLDRHLHDTVLDGEMVIDIANGVKRARYLVYDIIRLEGEDVGKLEFDKRLEKIYHEIIAPRHEAMKKGIIMQQKEPFSIRNKSFWDVTQAGALLGPKFAKTLSHEPDGLIFQPAKDPYVVGMCPEVLKWKPLELNSVDFKLKIVEESGIGILTKKIGHLYVGGKNDGPFSQIKLTRELRELDNKIIECKFENNSWVFMRERKDKSFPNSYNTAMNVWYSISHPVTTEILLKFIENNRYKNDTKRMPPPK